MIKITVTGTPLIEKRGLSKAGKPYHMRTQIAYAHVVDSTGVVCEIPEKFEIALDDGQAEYARGFYTLQPSSVLVKSDDFGHPALVLGRPRLVALPVQAAKPA